MASNNSAHSGNPVSRKQGPVAKETDGTMVNITKPTVEYDGYQRTITDVVRIRQEDNEDDPTGISELMVGLDDAIKVCRRLRGRLAGLHGRRDTGLYQKVIPKPIPSE